MNPMDKIKEMAKKDGFSSDEVDAIINHAKILTSKIIRDYLLEIAKEELEDKDKKKLKMLTKSIMKIDVTPHIGCEKIQMKGYENFTLVIQVGVADKRVHKFDICYPSKEALTAIFYRIGKFMEMVNAYYKQMMGNNKATYEMLCNFMSDIDFSELRINTNTWTLAFAEKSIMRIVPVIYYTDKNGHPIDLSAVDDRTPTSEISFDKKE